LDTLAHALESIWNIKANDLTRPLAVQSAQIVLKTLPGLLQNLHDHDARCALSKASLLAGLAMSQTQTALAHALSYDLTLHEKLPHGHACAVWLPMVMDMSAQRSNQVRLDLECVFGGSIDHASTQLTDWLLALNITPRDLRHTATGQHQLQQALDSLRGRNFIGSAL
jgi:alcohol dehydrogenase class IV